MKKTFFRLILSIFFLANFSYLNFNDKVHAADIWTEITDDDFSSNNQMIKGFSQFFGATFFHTDSNTRPFDSYGYYNGELIAIGSDAPFYNAEGALKVKNTIMFGGVLMVVVETTTIDQLWMYGSGWENLSDSLPEGTVSIDYINTLGEFPALIAYLQIADEEASSGSLWYFVDNEWLDFGDSFGGMDNLEDLNAFFLDFNGNQGIILSSFNSATEKYTITIGGGGGGWIEAYNSDYPIYDMAFYNEALFVISGSEDGLQILKFQITIHSVLSGLSLDITDGKFAQTEDNLYVAFSKANSGGPAQIYRSGDGDSWQFLTNVVGDGDSEGELALVTDIISLDQYLIIGTAQRGVTPTNAQLWLLEIDENAHIDNEEEEVPEPEIDETLEENIASNQNYTNSITTTSNSNLEENSDDDLSDTESLLSYPTSYSEYKDIKNEPIAESDTPIFKIGSVVLILSAGGVGFFLFRRFLK